MGSTLDEVRARFAEARLPFPPLPEEWMAGLQEQGKWMFSSRNLPCSPYRFDVFAREAETGSIPDYVVLAHDGHGTNSYAMHVFAVHEPLALFLQCAWGGVYMDNEKTTLAMEALFDQVGQLIAASDAAQRAGRWPHGKNLLVAASDFGGSGWAWIDSLLGGPLLGQEPPWSRRSGLDTLYEAVEAVASL